MKGNNVSYVLVCLAEVLSNCHGRCVGNNNALVFRGREKKGSISVESQ